MRIRALVLCGLWLALGTLTWGACGKEGADDGARIAARATSPEAAFALQYELLRGRDADGLWELYSQRVRKEMESLGRDLQRMPDAIFSSQFGYEKKEIEGLDARGIFRKMTTSPKMAERGFDTPTIEEVDTPADDIVVLRWKAEGAECRQRMRLEAGAWRIDALKACRRKSPRGLPDRPPMPPRPPVPAPPVP